MDLGLADRVALVAAGSSGLGLAVATALAAEGGWCPSAAGTGPAGPAVAKIEAVRSWVAGTAAEHGRLDIMAANAGSPPSGTAAALTGPAVREAVELTLLSAVTLVNAALPHLHAGGWGRVLLITSQSVKQPIPGLALSNTLWPALAAYAKTLVGELADSGVTVNVLAPGMTRTPALEEWAAELPAGLPGWPPTSRSAGWPSHRSSARWPRSWPASRPGSSPAPCSQSTAAPPAACCDHRRGDRWIRVALSRGRAGAGPLASPAGSRAFRRWWPGHQQGDIHKLADIARPDVHSTPEVAARLGAACADPATPAAPGHPGHHRPVRSNDAS